MPISLDNGLLCVLKNRCNALKLTLDFHQAIPVLKERPTVIDKGREALAQ